MTTTDKQSPPFNEDRMSREEAAEYLGLSYWTLSEWASYGKNDLPFHKVGRRCWYRRSELDKWLKKQERTQTDF